MKKNRKRRMRLLAAILAVTMSVSVCGTVRAEETSSGSVTSETNVAVDVSELFSERDLSGTYEESQAVSITLNGDSAACDSSAVSMEGGVVTISEEGVYVLSGTLADGSILVDAEDSDKVQLVLNGVSITSSTSAAIYVRQADKVFVTLAEGTENTLANGGSYVAIDDNNIDAVIFSKDDLTLNGSGSLSIQAAAGHGVVSKDDLVITGGTYNITAEKHGLAGKDSVCIADGTFTITCGKDGIHGDNDEDTTKGYVYIGGGTFTISAGDDGIHSSSGLTVAEGVIDILQSYEGLEGLTIDILGGTISVNSSDDGLNAAGGNDSSGSFGGDMFAVDENARISIQGGTISVNASGDGLDSNGNLSMSGGVVYVSGPEDDGNGALDYNGTAVITGGTIIAAGSSGMAQNFSSAENQGVMLVNTGSQAAGTVIALTDADGTEIVSWAPESSYSCVVISAPAIQSGSTYTLTACTYSGEITMDSLVYGESSGFGGMGGGFGGMDDRGGFPEGQRGQGERPEDNRQFPGEKGDFRNNGQQTDAESTTEQN